LVINELPHIIKKFDAKTIIVTNMLCMFLDDPQVKLVEAKSLSKSIMNTVGQLSANRSDIMVVSFHNDEPSRYSRLLFPNFNKYIQTFASSRDQITVKVKSSKEDYKTIRMGKEELEIIKLI
jgi:hypothetical protein